jgi:cytidylate kinase
VVFPNAELKLFLTASPEIRAKRRFIELQTKGENPIWEDVLADVNDRDYRDTHRSESPLRQAEDAVVVDNGEMTREEQMQYIIEVFRGRCTTV